MMNRHFIFALCTVLGFSVSGISMAQSVPTDKEAAAKAAKAAKVKFRWGKRGWKFVRWTALRPLSYKSYDKAY